MGYISKKVAAYGQFVLVFLRGRLSRCNPSYGTKELCQNLRIRLFVAQSDLVRNIFKDPDPILK